MCRFIRQHWLLHPMVGAAAAALYLLSGGGGRWELLYVAISAWAALGLLWAATRQPRSLAGALRAMAAGVGALTVGDAMWALNELRGQETPFPSWADAIYLSGYVLLSLGLVLLGRRQASVGSMSDACVVTAGISGVVWLSVLMPLLADGWSLEAVVSVAYPIGTVLLLLATSQLWLGAAGALTSVRLVTVGLIVWVSVDGIYAHQALSGTYAAGGALDLGWLTAYLLLAAGMLHPSLREVAQRRRSHVLSPNRFFLLAASSAAIPAATAIFGLEPVPPLMVLTIVAILLSALRLNHPVRMLHRQALTDPLTGLPNRYAFGERLAEALHGLQPGEELALLFCDLDHFKVVNDSLGHPAGDHLLREVADRLRACVRAGDTVARLGGDEFVVLVPAAVDASELAGALAARLLGEVGAPVVLHGDHRVSPSLSIGIRTCDEPGVEPSLLLSDADAAMYSAKSNGRGSAVRFRPEMRQAALDRLLVDVELRDALAHGQLCCRYQPEIDLTTGRLLAVECLVRWDHPVHGLLTPDRFIPHAEASGLIDEVFAFVLEDALSSQGQWAKVLGWRPPVAVNVSPVQSHDGGILRTVLTALARHEVPADSLWLEVTESALGDEDLLEALRALRAAGVRIAVDDFGTGWSSLGRLASARWDVLKIDRSFVRQVTDPTSDVAQVVAATAGLAHALGMLTVAEGVESEAELERVRDLGCDVAQGYLIARPMPSREVVAAVEALGPVEPASGARPSIGA